MPPCPVFMALDDPLVALFRKGENGQGNGKETIQEENSSSL